MTMRKNKKAYCPGPIKFLDMRLTLQARATLDAHGKLLGIASEFEQLLKRKAKIEAAAEARARYLPVPAAPAPTRYTTRYRGFIAPDDLVRLERAAARRERQQGARTQAYARCIAGNWNRTLWESETQSRVRVANKLHVDKAFVKLNIYR